MIYRGYEIRAYTSMAVEIFQNGELIDSTPTSIAEAKRIIDGWLDAP